MWETELKTEINDNFWKNNMVHIRKLTRLTKLWYFQYRIYFYILYTNVSVNKWNIKQSPLWLFCNQVKETAYHLLWQCNVQKIWKSLAWWVRYFCSVEIEFTAEIVILNNYKGHKKEMINTIILFVKHYIYCRRNR